MTSPVKPDERRRLIDSYRFAMRELSSQLEDDILKHQEAMTILRERLNKLLADDEQPGS